MFCFQIVYITATLPLILLIIFFFRGVHLKGYQEGLALLFIPEVSNHKTPLESMLIEKSVGKAIRVSLKKSFIKPNSVRESVSRPFNQSREQIDKKIHE